ncbi:hypothetical protein [Arthrobacter roseus]|uniref:hypothetical protein n=1 Tax=Arthrobacter roseus TaxID=136274 RepID=UPI00196653C2|nr:hypothetical protein [Arthrobacter roseus]MBM7848809.1 DNA-binding MarR family transcriptional regulator [Arthrobacter roseus]
MPALNGEHHPQSTITDHAVLTIRATYKPGTVTMSALAERFDTTPQNVSSILKRRTRKTAETVAVTR